MSESEIIILILLISSGLLAFFIHRLNKQLLNRHHEEEITRIDGDMTNFEWIKTLPVDKFVYYLRCPKAAADARIVCTCDCIQCATDWLNEKHGVRKVTMAEVNKMFGEEVEIIDEDSEVHNG